MKIGVLGFQGSVAEHVRVLERLGVESNVVRSCKDLDHVQGLILPGGESTVIGVLLRESGIEECIAQGDLPLFGTCAGAIVLAQMGMIDVEIIRNAYGVQRESFEAEVELVEGGSLSATFIRAPRIIGVGSGVKVIARLQDDPVVCRQKQVLVSTFHTELEPVETLLHEQFLGMCAALVKT